MGVLNGTSIFTSIIPEVEPPENNQYVVCLDCNINMYEGLVNLTQNLNENNAICATNTFSKIQSIVNYLRRTLKSDLIVKLYFDGRAPMMKFPTQVKRKDAFKHNCSISAVKEILIQRLKKEMYEGKPAYEIIDDEVGEGESNMFFCRDPTKSTILVTRDSDIFNILLDYKMQDENDIVYIYLPNKKTFYDINSYNLRLPPHILKLLCILSGTDFNDNLFTKSMIDKVLELARYNDFADDFPESVSLENIEEVVAKLLLCTLKTTDKKISVTFPKAQATLNKFIENESITKRLDWVYRYMSKGKDIEDYDDVGEVGTINKNNYLLYCYNKLKNTDFTSIKDMKKHFNDEYLLSIGKTPPKPRQPVKRKAPATKVTKPKIKKLAVEDESKYLEMLDDF